jgi:hypothetical protein
MDAYPEDYVNHNLPFVLLSGLEASSEDDATASAKYPLLSEKGPEVFSELPPVSGAVAEELRSVLLNEDGSRMPWKSRPSLDDNNSSAAGIGFKIKSTGRVGSCSDDSPRIPLC